MDRRLVAAGALAAAAAILIGRLTARAWSMSR